MAKINKDGISVGAAFLVVIGFLVAVPMLFATGVALGLVASIIEGWVFTKLWGWFIVTNFNLPQISLAVAIGISYLIALVTNHNMNAKKIPGEESNLIGMFGYLFIRPLVILFCGWITHEYLSVWLAGY